MTMSSNPQSIHTVEPLSPVQFAQGIMGAVGLELYPQQVAILKATYGEPLTEWERQFIYGTGGVGKVTYLVGTGKP